MQAAAPLKPGAPGQKPVPETGPSDLVIIFALIGVIILAFVIILVLNKKVITTLEHLLLKNKEAFLFAEEVVVEKSSG